MLYKYNPKTNKQRIAIYLLACASLAAGVVCVIFAGAFMGGICLLVGAYVAYTIFKTARRVQSAKIVTHDEGFSVYTSSGDKLCFDWGKITHCGMIHGGNQNGFVFAYDAESDKITTLPPVFYDFDEFIKELSLVPCYKDYNLEENQKIVDYLKAELYPEDADADERADAENGADESAEADNA